MKQNETTVLLAVYLACWVAIVALAVGGYDLLLAHVFSLPLIDWEGFVGAYLMTQAFALPYYALQGGFDTRKRR